LSFFTSCALRFVRQAPSIHGQTRFFYWRGLRHPAPFPFFFDRLPLPLSPSLLRILRARFRFCGSPSLCSLGFPPLFFFFVVRGESLSSVLSNFCGFFPQNLHLNLLPGRSAVPPPKLASGSALVCSTRFFLSASSQREKVIRWMEGGGVEECANLSPSSRRAYGQTWHPCPDRVLPPPPPPRPPPPPPPPPPSPALSVLASFFLPENSSYPFNCALEFFRNNSHILF